MGKNVKDYNFFSQSKGLPRTATPANCKELKWNDEYNTYNDMVWWYPNTDSSVEVSAATPTNDH